MAQSPTDATVQALRVALERKNRDVWPCTTYWPSILHFDGDAATYMAAPSPSIKTRIERDAQCIVLLDKLHDTPTGHSLVPYPFRAGAYACNALPTYKRYHAAWLAAYKLKVFFSNGDDSQLAAAYSHLTAALPWHHGEDTCPPQLRPHFVANVLGLLMLLIYAKGLAPGMKASLEQSAASISVLRFVQSLLPGKFAPVESLLAVEIASHWVEYECDPRPQITALSALNKSSVAAAAVAAIEQLHPSIMDLSAIARHKRMASMSVDRKDMGTAQFEFSVHSPLPSRIPLPTAWKLAYIVRVQEKLAATATLLDQPPIEVIARLAYMDPPDGPSDQCTS